MEGGPSCRDVVDEDDVRTLQLRNRGCEESPSDVFPALRSRCPRLRFAVTASPKRVEGDGVSGLFGNDACEQTGLIEASLSKAYRVKRDGDEQSAPRRTTSERSDEQGAERAREFGKTSIFEALNRHGQSAAVVTEC